jgi:2-furoyl-CoA dehydrogenase FAD binding subunit
MVAFAAAVGDEHVEFGIGGVSDRPQHRRLARGATLKDALNEVAWSLDAQDDVHASAAYRRQLVRELGLRLIEGA